MSSQAPQTIHLKDYQEANYRIKTIYLEIELDPDRTIIRSRTQYAHNPGRPYELRLQGCELQLVDLSINGIERSLSTLDYAADYLQLGELPEEFTLSQTTSTQPKLNLALEGIYMSQGKFFTQCEPEGFRRICYYLDRPDVMAEFTVKLIAPKATAPILLSNGNLIEEGDAPDHKHYAIWHDPFPKPSYLFALVAGDLHALNDSYTTQSGRKVALAIYVEHENKNKCFFAMQAIKHSMKWDEDTYGLEYDLDRFMVVAVSDFNMGAMENKGLNIFNAKYILASADTATDVDFENILGIVGHEYFHNWTGNRVTLRDWFQLSLKEGLTVFRDQEFSEYHASAAVKRLQEVKYLREHQFLEDSGPMAHPVRPEQYIEINNFYTSTVYRKGAEVIRMLHTLLGEQEFHSKVTKFLRTYDGCATTVENFLEIMGEGAKFSMDQFKLWYQQAGTPEVRVQMYYNEHEKVFTLHLEQILPITPDAKEKKPQLIPVRVGLLGSHGQDLSFIHEGKEAEEHVLMLTQKNQSFQLEGVTQRPVLSIFRQFSAPIKITTNLSRDDRYMLLTHDTDAFNRLEAAQILMQECILDHATGQSLELDTQFISAFQRLVTSPFTDLRLIALAMQVPPVDYLMQVLPQLTMDAIYASRKFLLQAIAQSSESLLLNLYHRHHDRGPYSIEREAIGKRELKNACMALLAEANPNAAINLALEQFKTASNMTDAFAALSVLEASQSPHRLSSLESFYQRWQHDPLVIDKWFAVQSCSTHPEVLGHVETLLKHQDFDISNPNRVYAVFRQFARCHPLGFHHVSGRGYRLIADYVLRIDSQNPQVASTLVSSLSRYKSYDATRQALMRKELERIALEPKLSHDVFEIVSKSLK